MIYNEGYSRANDFQDRVAALGPSHMAELLNSYAPQGLVTALSGGAQVDRSNTFTDWNTRSRSYRICMFRLADR